ncbi:hypothetical protein [Sphingomonas sp. PB4P5]|uniref:hypothetical protein n=1 Tax=Parasphingomonas puruogangriensis TaxID=3096155 RepID=UPI002FC6D293
MIVSILLMLAQTAPAIDGLPIAPLAAQSLPATGCAAYLFAPGAKPVFLAMAGTDPAQLRVSLAGKVTDLPRTSQNGTGPFGFAGSAEYAAGGVTAVLDMKITTRADLKDGAAVSDATLRIDREGADSMVVPVAGIVACAK